jgi:hypothetical protein
MASDVFQVTESHVITLGSHLRHLTCSAMIATGAIGIANPSRVEEWHLLGCYAV